MDIVGLLSSGVWSCSFGSFGILVQSFPRLVSFMATSKFSWGALAFSFVLDVLMQLVHGVLPVSAHVDPCCLGHRFCRLSRQCHSVLWLCLFHLLTFCVFLSPMCFCPLAVYLVLLCLLWVVLLMPLSFKFLLILTFQCFCYLLWHQLDLFLTVGLLWCSFFLVHA